jgi:hypothetical protein
MSIAVRLTPPTQVRLGLYGQGLQKCQELRGMQEPAGIQEPRDEETPGSAALYIASLANELAQLAKRNGLESLSYILDMARLEADQVFKDSGRARNCPGPIPPRTAN